MSKPGKELYVGSLSYDVTEYDLEKMFAVSGTVTSVHLICDNVTGQFKGCGYVRMSTEAEAKDAVVSLDGAMLIDRQITVSIANPQKMKPQGGGARGKFIPKGGAKAAGSAAGKPATAKPAAARPVPGKPAAEKARFSKSDAPKAGFSKPASSRPASSRPSSSKSGTTRTKR